MDDIFNSSNSEVLTGKFVVAIAGVEADVEEDEPERAEAIEIDQGSDTMKTLWNLRVSITEIWRKETEKRKRKTERELKLKNSSRIISLNIFSQYNTKKSTTHIYTLQRREIARGRLVTASHVL